MCIQLFKGERIAYSSIKMAAGHVNLAFDLWAINNKYFYLKMDHKYIRILSEILFTCQRLQTWRRCEAVLIFNKFNVLEITHRSGSINCIITCVPHHMERLCRYVIARQTQAVTKLHF